MTSQFAMSAMSVLESLLWFTLGLLFFWRRGMGRRFPAMATYLALHLLSTPILLFLFYALSKPWGRSLYGAYFFGYFAVYIAGVVLLLFISMEIFRSALAAVPGLMRIGIVVFRWAILVSLILTLSSLSFHHQSLQEIVPIFAYSLMRSVSILELCLLGFLCLSMNALRLSLRDLSFGMALGFGVMAANEFILASFTTHGPSLTTPLEFLYESLILISLSIWIVYCALPEPIRKPIVMPASSAIYRWNEIASALGHTGTQVAVQQPANGFFLTDVEKVVEKVLNRNLKGRESEL
jgi:hypothetical protein